MDNQMKSTGSKIRLEQQNRANKWIHLLGSCCCCPWIVQLAQHQTMTPLIKGSKNEPNSSATVTKMDKIQQGIFLDQETEDLKLSIVQPEEVGEVSDFLLAHFFAQEPLGAHLGLDPEKEVRSWLPNVLDHEIKEGVSILARNKMSGEIVAVCINDVIRRKEDPNDVTVFSYVQRDEQPSMWRIGQILEALLDGHDLFADHDRPGVIILQMLSVRPDQTGRGLAAKLIHATENLSRQDPKGQFGLVVSEATSQFSFRAFLRAGFVSIKRIQYQEFELDGEKSSPERPFRLLGERSIHTGADLMIKRIC